MLLSKLNNIILGETRMGMREQVDFIAPVINSVVGHTIVWTF